MIPVKTDIDARLDNVTMSAFGIQINDKTFKVLFDGLYTHKIRSITRELWTNCLDSHVEKGTPNRPFKVTLPTPLDPTYTVRDFGVSLTDDQVHNVYTQVFATSKAYTNAQTGYLGLGSKSPFAYCDSFDVRAFLNGEVRKYVAAYDGDGIPQIITVGSEPTDEEDGLEVSFAVRSTDINNFAFEANRISLGFDVLPECEGVALSKPPIVWQTEGCKVYRNSGWDPGVYIKQGPVLYPTPVAYKDLANLFRNNYEIIIVIEVPIGTVDFAANREQLQWTSATQRIVDEQVDRIESKLLEEVRSQVDACTNNFDILSLTKDLNQIYQIDRFKDGSFLRGEEFFRKHGVRSWNSSLPFWISEDVGMRRSVDINKWSHPFPKDTFITIRLDEIPEFRFVIDRPEYKSPGKKGRFHHYSSLRNGSVFWLDDPSPKFLERIMRCFRLDREQIMTVFDLPDAPKKPKSSGDGDIRGVKQFDYRATSSGGYFQSSTISKFPDNFYWFQYSPTEKFVKIPGVIERTAWQEITSYFVDLLKQGLVKEGDTILAFTEHATGRFLPPEEKHFSKLIKKNMSGSKADLLDYLKIPHQNSWFSHYAERAAAILGAPKRDFNLERLAKVLQLDDPDVQKALEEREKMIIEWRREHPLAFGNKADESEIRKYLERNN